MKVDFSSNNTHSNYQQSFKGIRISPAQADFITEILQPKDVDKFHKLCKKQEANNDVNIAFFKAWNHKLSANVFTENPSSRNADYLCNSYFQRDNETPIKFIRRMCNRANKIADKISEKVF